VALPWLLGRRRAPGSFKAVVEPPPCHPCTHCSQDCPFDAITMVARTDGKNFPAQAWVDPARCVGCGVCAGSCDSEGISVAWFDTRHEEARIFAEFTATLANDGLCWVALVGADAEGALGFLAATCWRERLPDYQVYLVPTASWVRPRFVEQLLRSGAKGVLVVRDARAEAPARDGNRWVQARLAGERPPIFRAARAGDSSAWHVVDFDPSRPDALRCSAEEFRSPPLSAARQAAQLAAAMPRRNSFRSGIIMAALALVLGAITVGASRVRVHNPASADPEFVFSFRLLSERVEAGVIDAAADAAKPIHMRGRPTTKPHRTPVLVKLMIDGVAHERRFRAKGISEDGPALDEWRQPLAPGPHAIVIEIIAGTATTFRWSAEIDAQPRRLHVVTFEPDAGFRVE
jgi:ferredoxin